MRLEQRRRWVRAVSGPADQVRRPHGLPGGPGLLRSVRHEPGLSAGAVPAELQRQPDRGPVAGSASATGTRRSTSARRSARRAGRAEACPASTSASRRRRRGTSTRRVPRGVARVCRRRCVRCVVCAERGDERGGSRWRGRECERERECECDANANADASASASAGDAGDRGAGVAARAQIDDDGNDEPEDPGTGSAPASGRFEKVGTPPLALTRICDLTPFGDALYAAHANQPLGTDGATITRYRPSDAKKPFAVAFDWNRPGEPTKGGGAGQGFLRVHAIGGRLFVAGCRPAVQRARARRVRHRGLRVRVRSRGRVRSAARAALSSAGGSRSAERGRPGRRGGAAARVSRDRRHRGIAVGSSHRRGRCRRRSGRGTDLRRARCIARATDGSRWTYEVDYPYPWQDGVWRLTFMVRFRDRLYAGIQDYDGRDPNDYVYFAPRTDAEASADADAGAKAEAGAAPPAILRREDEHPVRVTRSGAAGTLRWWVDTRAKPARLYWLAWSRDTGVLLRVTTDGDHWAAIALPADAGRPTDVTRFRDAVVVLDGARALSIERRRGRRRGRRRCNGRRRGRRPRRRSRASTRRRTAARRRRTRSRPSR